MQQMLIRFNYLQTDFWKNKFDLIYRLLTQPLMTSRTLKNIAKKPNKFKNEWSSQNQFIILKYNILFQCNQRYKVEVFNLKIEEFLKLRSVRGNYWGLTRAKLSSVTKSPAWSDKNSPLFPQLSECSGFSGEKSLWLKRL